MKQPIKFNFGSLTDLSKDDLEGVLNIAIGAVISRAATHSDDKLEDKLIQHYSSLLSDCLINHSEPRKHVSLDAIVPGPIVEPGCVLS